MESIKRQYDKLVAGLIPGLIGPWLGAWLFNLIMFNHLSILEFARMIINTGSTHAPLISVSLIFNLVFFYLFLRNDMYNAAKGVIMAVFLYAPFVVYFKYVA
jgi:hypothetical protein